MMQAYTVIEQHCSMVEKVKVYPGTLRGKEEALEYYMAVLKKYGLNEEEINNGVEHRQCKVPSRDTMLYFIETK